MDKSTWLFLLMLPHQCLHYTQGGCLGQQKVFAHLKRFMASNQPSFQKESSHALCTPHSHHSLEGSLTITLCQCLILGSAEEYSHTIKVFQPMVLVIPLEDIVAALCQLHPLPSNHVLPLIFYYQLEHTFVLDKTLFAHVLAVATHLSSSGLFGMVYEHFSRCFISEDPSLRFLKLFQVVSTIARGDIPSVADNNSHKNWK